MKKPQPLQQQVNSLASRRISLTPESPVVEKKADRDIPKWWMKNDKGKSSTSVTFASISFIVTTFVYLAAAFEKLGPVTMRPFDVGACVAYFLPALSLYFGRRLTDAKYNSQEQAANDTNVSN